MDKIDILLVNDDGIQSNGLLELKNSLENNFDANVTVVAPSNQQSGIGRAISLFEPLRITKVKLPDCTEGFAVSGTPTDCVVLGIFKILDKIPDYVVSGINIGENLGTEITTSGTLGAAFEGAHHGAKSIACSLQVKTDDIKFNEGHAPVEFKNSAKILSNVLKKSIECDVFDSGCDVLNVNVPHEADAKTPWEITTLAKKMYTTHIDQRKDPRGRDYYWIDGSPVYDEEEGTDVHAVRNKNNVSITPLTLDTTLKNLELFKKEYSDKLI
ncbi:5'/3'-nucleotidase SurE [Methanococcus voltae]|uniref:5'-nucleotidase SurE n=1 Tax=Methanococcus voltae TaxID=2188 RepID=A0A8J7UTB3_METVO|nr:5'/3'-nucleotidase SurE [Methanococcus voltae]MBP2172589.1 5'-nucleotidase [Methanococcus voltae]MBP2201504.1 5'-nucleotidase [Methanococcus voltae]